MDALKYSIKSQKLVDVAMGRLPADLVIKDGKSVSVQSGEILPGTQIAIFDEYIAYVGPDASHTIGDNTEVFSADGMYLVPGLLDGHMHVESGMLTITEFVRAVIPHGTTGMFIDPHEIANVFGLSGVRLMVDEGRIQPIHVWVQVPSCVPSAPGMESPGAVIGPKDIAEAMQWQGIIGLGEMMNFPGVYNSIKNVHDEMGETLSKGKIIGGHYASPDIGIPFHGYVAGGPEDDHEGTRVEDAVARVRQGMKVMLRQGSAWHDVSEGVRAITELGLDSRHFILCTDDSHSQTLVSDGHVNRAVNKAIENGIDPITAIQMATINTAEHFMLSREIGMIAPRRYADILCVKNLTHINPEVVFGKGRMIAKEGNILIDIPSYNYPEWAVDSIHINRKIGSNDFIIKVPENKKRLTNKESILVNVIGIIENQAPTKHIKMEVPVIDGKISANLELDLAKVSVIERHHGTGSIQIGLVHGFGLKGSCAVASSVAHDSHNLIVVGTGDNEMAKAVEELVIMGGGQIVIKDGEVVGRVNLPIAGLMSSENAKEVAKKAGSVLSGFKDCGCNINNPNMQLSLLALVVIPELRLSDKGLVDVNHFKIISLFD